MFSGNIFVGTLNIDIVKPSMKKKKKKITSSKKALKDDMTQTVNKCVKSKSSFKFTRTLSQYKVDNKCCNEYISKLQIRCHAVINIKRHRGEKDRDRSTTDLI